MTMPERTRAGLRTAVAFLLLLAMAMIAAPAQPALGAAQPILGVYRVQKVVITGDSPRLLGGTAYCEAGDYVLGGGARAFADDPAADRLLALGEVHPIGAPRPGDGRHGYTAYAAEMTPGTASDWSLSVTALCSSEPVPGHRIVETVTGTSSASPKSTAPNCGPGRVALGAGAYIYKDPREPDPLGASITEVRPVEGGMITSAVGREWPGGYSGEWTLRGYAVCAYPPSGYQVRHTDAQGRSATVLCTGTRRVLGAGASASTALGGALPQRGPEGAAVQAPRNATTHAVSAWATCADTAPAPPPEPPDPPDCPPNLPDCEEQ